MLVAQFRKQSTPVLFLNRTPSAVILMKIDADIFDKMDVEDATNTPHTIKHLFVLNYFVDVDSKTNFNALKNFNFKTSKLHTSKYIRS